MRPNISKTPSVENRDVTIEVGGEKYILEIFFVNTSGFLKVQPNVFKQLEFRDNIFNPFLSLTLVLRNNKNEIESNLFTTPTEIFDEGQFEFKGNSDEFVLIKFKPDLQTGPLDDKDQFPYKLELPCFIKDEVEFVEGEDTYKAFDLMDVKYRELSYPTKQWSTNQVLENQAGLSQMSDDERAVFTGDALKNVIETFASDKIINPDRWDKGSSKLFYSSSIDTTPMHIIDYIIENHVSEKNSDMCLLREDKFGKLNFLSIKDIFDGIQKDSLVGPEMVGSFELPTEQEEIGNSYREPNKNISPLIANFPVTKYNYLNFSATSSLERLRSTNVVNYSFTDKKFNFYKKDGDITNTIDYFNDNILSNVPAKNAHVAFEPGENVLKRNLFTTMYSTSDESVARYEGRNELIKNLLYLSNNLELEVFGNINLRSGKFLNIVRKTGIDSKFERKLQGCYFILDTHHIINNTEYISNVIATKPYTV